MGTRRVKEITQDIAEKSEKSAKPYLIHQCQRIGRAPLGYVNREDLAPGLRMAALSASTLSASGLSNW